MPDAHKIACDYQHCTEEQCCEALCTRFACPNGFVPMPDAREIACNDQRCTKEQCCTYTAHDKTKDGLRRRRADEQKHEYCNSIGCPNAFLQKDNPWETPCPYDDCSVDNCCEVKCSSLRAQTPSRPRTKTSTAWRNSAARRFALASLASTVSSQFLTPRRLLATTSTAPRSNAARMGTAPMANPVTDPVSKTTAPYNNHVDDEADLSCRDWS